MDSCVKHNSSSSLSWTKINCALCPLRVMKNAAVLWRWKWFAPLHTLWVAGWIPNLLLGLFSDVPHVWLPLIFGEPPYVSLIFCFGLAWALKEDDILSQRRQHRLCGSSFFQSESSFLPSLTLPLALVSLLPPICACCSFNLPSVSSFPPVLQGDVPLPMFNVPFQMKIIENSVTLFGDNGTALPLGNWWKNILLLFKHWPASFLFPGISAVCFMCCKFNHSPNEISVW